nr:serine/threonine-protein kinase [Kofleriaceae bacterium]
MAAGDRDDEASAVSAVSADGAVGTVGTAPASLPAAPRASPRVSRAGPFELLRVLGRGSIAVVYGARERDRPGVSTADAVDSGGATLAADTVGPEPAAAAAVAIDSGELHRVVRGPGAPRPVRDVPADTEVAVKVVRSPRLANDGELRARALRDLRAALAVSHANLVVGYDAGDRDGELWVATELVAGTSLATWLAAEPRSAADTVRTAVAAGRGLAALHAAGVVHRDVKPDNVFVVRDGRRAILADAAIACARPAERRELAGLAVDDLRARTGSLAGTPRYLSPEQLRGTVDARSDQFAFAVMLAEALGRQHPFAGATLGELWASVASGRRRGGGPGAIVAPLGVTRALDRALRVEPGERFERVDDLLDALDAAVAGGAPRLPRRARVAIAATLAVIAAAAVAVVIGTGSRGDDPTDAAPRTTAHGDRLAPVDSPGTRPNAHPSDESALRIGPVDPVGAGSGLHDPWKIILVAPFVNLTGDPRFDDTLDVALAADLQWSHRYDVLAGAQLRELTNSAHLDVNFAAGNGALNAVSLWLSNAEDAATTLVHGHVEKSGNGYVIAYDALPDRGTQLAGEIEVRSADDAVAAVAEIGARIRMSLADDDTTRHPAVSRSLSALHELAQAQLADLASDDAAAELHVQRALAADPDLGEAHVVAADLLAERRDRVGAATELGKAVDSPTMSGRGRASANARRADMLGQHDYAVGAYREILAAWPHDVTLQIDATRAALDGSHFGEALSFARAASVEHGEIGAIRSARVITELAAGHLDTAFAAADVLLAGSPSTFPSGTIAAALAYALHGDDASSVIAMLDDKHRSLVAADIEYYRGDIRAARLTLERAIAAATAAHDVADYPVQLVMLARIELDAGDTTHALAHAELALSTDGIDRVDYLAAEELAEAGAMDVVADLANQWADSKLVDVHLAGLMLTGEIAILHHNYPMARLWFSQALEMGGDAWLEHERVGRVSMLSGDTRGGMRELDWCEAHRGAGAIYLASSLWLVADLEREIAIARSK